METGLKIKIFIIIIIIDLFSHSYILDTCSECFLCANKHCAKYWEHRNCETWCLPSFAVLQVYVHMLHFAVKFLQCTSHPTSGRAGRLSKRQGPWHVFIIRTRPFTCFTYFIIWFYSHSSPSFSSPNVLHILIHVFGFCKFFQNVCSRVCQLLFFFLSTHVREQVRL